MYDFTLYPEDNDLQGNAIIPLAVVSNAKMKEIFSGSLLTEGIDLMYKVVVSLAPFPRVDYSTHKFPKPKGGHKCLARKALRNKSTWIQGISFYGLNHLSSSKDHGSN
jgi:hypothetical protein